MIFQDILKLGITGIKLLPALCLVGAWPDLSAAGSEEFLLTCSFLSISEFCRIADLFLFFDGFFLDSSEFDKTLPVTCPVYEMEVRTIRQRFQNARGS